MKEIQWFFVTSGSSCSTWNKSDIILDKQLLDVCNLFLMYIIIQQETKHICLFYLKIVFVNKIYHVLDLKCKTCTYFIVTFFTKFWNWFILYYSFIYHFVFVFILQVDDWCKLIHNCIKVKLFIPYISYNFGNT